MPTADENLGVGDMGREFRDERSAAGGAGSPDVELLWACVLEGMLMVSVGLAGAELASDTARSDRMLYPLFCLEWPKELL